MNKSARVWAGLLIPAFFVAGAIASPAMAQGKATLKEILKNDQVRVYEVVFKPGDEAPNVERPYRVVRALKGGTLERNYPDGKKQKVEWKAGEVKAIGPDKAYRPKNIGKTDVQLYVVEIK
jgi:hypothetical protein